MRKKYVVAISVVIGFIVFIGIALVTDLFSSGELPVQIAGALLEAVVTAFITFFLLTGQTAKEELKERQVKVFEKKQEVYHAFLEELKRIIQDGEITINRKDKAGEVDKSVDELKDLIFQFGYLQMHTSKDTINIVIDCVSNIIQLMNEFNSIQGDKKQKGIPEFYSALSENLFNIIAVLKKDLYDKESYLISKDKMNSIFQECDLFIETKFNKYELQKYFWDELQEQLIIKGFVFEKKDFTQDINEYYSRARNRHRWYGFSFEIYKSKTGRSVVFFFEIENSYYYGIGYKDKPGSDDKLNVVITKTNSSFHIRKDAAAWKTPDSKFIIDFWKLNSEGIKTLTDSTDSKKRDAYIKDIADSVVELIKRFQKNAMESEL